ncbi:MAG TPA: alpha-glucan family phosphorylase [Saprospiraceae bacterium]|nr:alpha-glucan family phosphorylase [Saprospiraceae bacterium]
MGQNNFQNFHFPFQVDKSYSKRVTYLCMEFAIDQSLKTYSGGLGFLAGSHMRSAYALKQNLIGVGLLWKYGYYDQERSSDNSMYVLFQEKAYNFLQDTGIKFEVKVNSHTVWVKAFYLDPHIFGTAPMFFLSTDLPENDFLSQTITHKLYDSNAETKIAQGIVLGVGAGMLMDAINHSPDIYHLNEAHGLPVAFYLYNKYRSKEAVQKRIIFTTHTPIPAGNEKHPMKQLLDLSFFQDMTEKEVRDIMGVDTDTFDHSLAALRLAKIANGVSEIHGKVSNKMWGEYKDIAEIISVTNAQNKSYWVDTVLEQGRVEHNAELIRSRKRELRLLMLEEVADQTGKLFSPDVFTIVWARRFAEYKRPKLITEDLERFVEIFENGKYRVQIIWAGKPYPKDEIGIKIFNDLVEFCKKFPNVAILTGYELKLSKIMKQGSDLWLNNPRIPLEASGTSGMTAMMNACPSLSTFDGWIPEFVKDDHNGFIVPPVDYNTLSEVEQDTIDRDNMLDKIKDVILPMYYDHPAQWDRLLQAGMDEIVPFFDSDRMAAEYYDKMYNS